MATRSTNFEVFVPRDKEKIAAGGAVKEEEIARTLAIKRSIIRSINKYRACLRKCYAMNAIAEISGAAVIHKENGDLELQGAKDTTRGILATMFSAKEMPANPPIYAAREFIRKEMYPSSKSFIFDDIKEEIRSRWDAKDPFFPKASRGWLTLQGPRQLARYSRIGIPFPKATARPKVSLHRVCLSWDFDIGKVELAVGRMDIGRLAVWRNIVNGEGGYSYGTMYLKEKKGALWLTVTYTCPDKLDGVRLGRKAKIDIGETGIVVTGPPAWKNIPTFTVPLNHIIGGLRRFAARKDAITARRKSCGGKQVHRRGHLKDQEVLSRYSASREAFVKDSNHVIARRLCTEIRNWRCGEVRVSRTPDKLMGHTWQWYQLRQFIKYKCEEMGCLVIFEEDEDKRKKGLKKKAQA